ncbi:MAG: hypothetical protein Q8Q26_08870 [Pseudorhodobacter sp.]|nr:hypothetical protein [Pseudorhodobacter sp.]
MNVLVNSAGTRGERSHLHPASNLAAHAGTGPSLSKRGIGAAMISAEVHSVLVESSRQLGLIDVIELVKATATRRNFEMAPKVSPWVANQAMECGLIARASIDDTIAICPLLIITEPQSDNPFDALRATLDDAPSAFDIVG